jgi:thermitase
LGLSANSRFDTRQFSVLAVAMVWAVVLLLAPAPVAQGEAAAQPKVDEDPSGAPYVAGELLVAYEPGTSQDAEQAVVRGSGGLTAEDLPGRMRLVSFPGIAQEKSREARERALQRKLEGLRDEPHIEAADYNFILSASWVPNDPKFGDPAVVPNNDPDQWGLKKATTDFTGAWNDARGDATRAGVKTAKIAILDSGIDQNHPDLSGKIADQYDFLGNDAVANDPYGHGTQVAGIAAALTNNGRGVAGGCPRCKLLVARVLDANGDTTVSRVIDGIDWSTKNGADVINLSFGSSTPSDFLRGAIDQAYAKGNGTVVVAAAGNEWKSSVEQYPAAYDAAIAVSATDKDDRLADFSSRGNWVDLAAPGTAILSTRATRVGEAYDKYSGTSESAPFVSALAGLLASEGKTAIEIRRRMQNTAKDLGAAGDDPNFGHGRIDANRAVP